MAGKRGTVSRGLRVLAPLISLAAMTATAEAQLVGAKVVAGKATITQTATGVVIDELTSKAVITYSSFSLPQNYTLTLESSVSGSLLVNKVTGGVASVLASGSLITGSVQFWLINPAGITVAPGATIDTAGVLLSTLGVSSHSGGSYTFSASGNSGAGVTNGGTITATGGYAVLAGEQVSNTGVIVAALGTVVLAGGAQAYAVDFSGDHLLSFAITTPIAQANGTLVSNTGTVAADGGLVLLTAASANAVLENVINTSGIIEATSVQNVDGKIVLSASGGGTEVSGTLDASGKGAGQTGGEVDVLSDQSVTLASGALVDVSGDAGGGTALIGGNFHGAGPQVDAVSTTVAEGATINASAITSGNGGKVAIWSNDNTVFDGSIVANGGAESGNGGYIETSGKSLTLGLEASVVALGPNGSAGTWLLDPETLTIGDDPTIDFTTLASGAVSPTQYAADGLTVYLVDTFPDGSILDAEAGTGGEGISNSEGTFGSYPTYSYMVFQWAAPVSNVSFYFNNYGNNELSNYFTVTNGVDSCPVGIYGDSDAYSLVTVPGSGFTELVVSNGENGDNWYLAVSSLTYTGGGSGSSFASPTTPTPTTTVPVTYLVAPPPPPPPPILLPTTTGGGGPPPPPPPTGGSTTGGGVGTLLGGGGGGSTLFGTGGTGTPVEPISAPPPPIHPAPLPEPKPQTSDDSLGAGLFQAHPTFVSHPGEVFGISSGQAPSDGNWALYWSAGFAIP